MPRRLVSLTAAVSLQLVAVVLAHQLVYLARYESLYGEALVHSGHGEAWGAAVTTSLVLGGALVALAAFRLGHLRLLIGRRGGTQASTDRRLDVRPLLRAYLLIAPRLVVLSVVLLTLQENLEHAAGGQGTPGPWILLTREYAGGLWITIGVGLVVAFVAALFQWRHRVLLERLRAARPRIRRTVIAPAPRPEILRRPTESLLGRRSALRAPPGIAAS